jgi:hypothetical protein
MNSGLIFILALMVAFLVYFIRRMVTGRSRQTATKDWLLYFLIAPLMIAAFMGCFFYAERKGIDEETTVKWMNISLTAVFVFGYAVKKFWNSRRKWIFWAELGVLIVAHFMLLSRLHWQQASFFWLMVVVGIPEMAFVFFLIGLMFKPNQRRTAVEIADIIERFLNQNSSYLQEWNDFVECREPDSRLDTYRKRCDELDPLVNSPGPQDPKAIAELRSMVGQLRRLEIQTDREESTDF